MRMYFMYQSYFYLKKYAEIGVVAHSLTSKVFDTWHTIPCDVVLHVRNEATHSHSVAVVALLISTMSKQNKLETP